MSSDIYYGKRSQESALFFRGPYESILNHIKKNAINCGNQQLAGDCDWGISMRDMFICDYDLNEIRIIYDSLRQIVLDDDLVFNWKMYETYEDMKEGAAMVGDTLEEWVQRMRRGTLSCINQIISHFEGLYPGLKTVS